MRLLAGFALILSVLSILQTASIWFSTELVAEHPGDRFGLLWPYILRLLPTDCLAPIGLYLLVGSGEMMRKILRSLAWFALILGVLSIADSAAMWFGSDITPNLKGLKWQNFGPDIQRLLPFNCLALFGLLLLVGTSRKSGCRIPKQQRI